MALSDTRRRLVERLRSSRTRARERLFLVEGIRAAGEALGAGIPVRFAVLSPRLDELSGGPALRRRLREGGGDVVEASDEELGSVSDTDAPQGVLLVCPEPDGSLGALAGREPRTILLADGVQDPGNLGTLLRSSRAFALDAMVALDGTVDPWNPKVVRAAAGASFRLPIARASWEEAEPWLAGRGLELLGAAVDGEDVRTVRPRGPWALALGNEGAGLRPEIAARCRGVAVPMPGGGESLNVGVAGSILLFALTAVPTG